jgi:hypothetical protein
MMEGIIDEDRGGSSGGEMRISSDAQLLRMAKLDT